MRRVLGGRWFSGFATAVVLLGVVAVAGFPWGGVGESSAGQVQGAGQIRVQFPWLPEPGRTDQWIEVQSFHWGVQASSTRPSSGPPKVSEIQITKWSDAASPRLHLALANGERISEVTIEICKQDCAKGVVYHKIVFTDATITSYNLGGSAGDAFPTESISMNYGRIEITYNEQDKEGNPLGTLRWDCTEWPECVPG
ncbi:MAG TPA: type VI secretion system tube protein Hcp [Thermoplasmata archaeon]|nr:type VI secretion system tube protein Hcp [Thermoplasmata archaeon]